MTKDEIIQLINRTYIDPDLPSNVFDGLMILRKYVRNADIISIENNFMFSNVDLYVAEFINISKKDLLRLFRMNWLIYQNYFVAHV